jgi:hypothetical protein
VIRPEIAARDWQVAKAMGDGLRVEYSGQDEAGYFPVLSECCANRVRWVSGVLGNVGHKRFQQSRWRDVAVAAINEEQ